MNFIKAYLITIFAISTYVFGSDSEEKSEAIILYGKLLEERPDDPVYLYSLGKAYYDIEEWELAAQNFEKTLIHQPKNSDAEVLLAYSLLFQAENRKLESEKTIKRSQEIFEKVLREVPDYKDAKQGLERVANKRMEKKEILPEKPLKKVEEEKPKEKIAKIEKEIQEILLERAKALFEQENFWGAIEIYSYLTEKHPRNPEYWFFLGRAYVRAGCRCFGKYAFERSLEIKDNYSDSLIFLGKHYFADREYCIAEELLERAVQSNPKDVAGIISLARVKAALEEYCEAEELFLIAYEMAPQDIDVLYPFASYLISSHRYLEAENLYRIYEANEGNDEIYRNSLFDVSSHTAPTLFMRAGTAEEREKDLFSRRWVASLRYYNTEIGGIFPINDRLRFTPRIRSGTQRQRLLVSKRTQFDVKFVGGGLKTEWIFCRNWTMIADLSMEWISNNHCPVVLRARKGTKVEPTLIFRYERDLDLLLFGETTDTIVFRNFKTKRASVVTRDAAVFTYQRDFEDYRYLGVNLAWIWYQDRIRNQEQDASIWFQAGVPYIEDFLSARYQCDYRHFYHETTGYYSFQYQLTHWLKLRSTKRWLSGAHYELEYWHGWRTTKGRNPQQQLVVGAIDAFGPVTTVENQIDQVFVTVGYMPDDDLDFTLGGTYYHDSFDYTIMGAKIQMEWRF